MSGPPLHSRTRRSRGRADGLSHPRWQVPTLILLNNTLKLQTSCWSGICSWMKLRVLTRQQVGSEQATEPTGSPQNKHHISTQSENTPLHLKPAAAPEQTEVCSSLWTRRHNSTDDAAASVWTSGFILTLRFSDEAASDLVISVTGRWTSLSLSPGCEWTRGCSEFFTESCCSFNAGFVQSRWSKSVGWFNWNHLLIKCRHFLLTTDTQTCFHRTWRGNWYFSFYSL